MATRRPTKGRSSSRGAFGGGIVMELDPAFTSIAENISRMRGYVMANIAHEMNIVAQRMKAEAEKKAETAYISHGNRHPSDRYPSSKTASESIIAGVVNNGTSVTAFLAYDESVIQDLGTRKPITYGGILEAEAQQKGTAVIRPTFKKWNKDVKQFLQGAAFVGFAAAPPGAGKGATRIPGKRVNN